jgi:hypothetical protein
MCYVTNEGLIAVCVAMATFLQVNPRDVSRY